MKARVLWTGARNEAGDCDCACSLEAAPAARELAAFDDEAAREMAGKERGTMVKRFLFETRMGLWLVEQLERRTGLALVDAEWLGTQRAGWPAGMSPEEGQVEEMADAPVSTTSSVAPAWEMTAR